MHIPPLPADRCCIHKVRKKHSFQVESDSKKPKSRLETIPAMGILRFRAVDVAATILIYPSLANILILTDCLVFLPPHARMFVERS